MDTNRDIKQELIDSVFILSRTISIPFGENMVSTAKNVGITLPEIKYVLRLCIDMDVDISDPEVRESFNRVKDYCESLT